jgi:hypothetical protein
MMIPRLGKRSSRYKPGPQTRVDTYTPSTHLSIVGHVGTIRQDRRDAEVMRRYAFAAAREAARSNKEEG